MSNTRNDMLGAATAEAAYNLAASKMDASFSEIQEFYDIELGVDGSIIGDEARLVAAKRKFDPPTSSKNGR